MPNGDNSFIKQYVMELVPRVNTKAWQDASKKVKAAMASPGSLLFGREQSKIQKLLSGLTDKNGNVIAGKEAEFKKYSEQLAKIDNNIAKVDTAMGNAVSGINLLVDVINKSINTANKILDKSSIISNQFVGADTAFVDTNVRSMMATMGIDATKAQGLSTALSALGMSLNEIGISTEGQRKALIRLYNTYEDGINKIDPDKLARYNEKMQEYEIIKAEFEIKFQTAMIKLFAESESLPHLIDSVSEGLNTFSEFLSSPLIQTAFDTITEFLATVIDFATIIGKTFSFGANLLGGNTSSTYNTTTTNNNVTINGNIGNNSDSYSNYSIARQLFSMRGSR